MIIGINAAQRMAQYGAITKQGVFHYEYNGQGNIESLPLRLQTLIDETELPTSGVIVLGPGVYNGIRLSVTTIKMLAAVHGFNVHGVSLFDAYMTLNHAKIKRLTLLTSPSRKGMVNFQLFQATLDTFNSISSLHQVSYEQLRRYFARFQEPLDWHHIDEKLPEDSIFKTAILSSCNLIQLMRHYETRDALKGNTLHPIYAFPAV